MITRRSLLFLFAALLLATGTAHARPGSPDPTFAGEGREPAFIPFFGEDRVQDVFVRRDRRIVVAGTTVDGYGVALARLRPDGQPDSTFGEAGRVTFGSAAVGRSPMTVIATPGPKDSIFVVVSRRTSEGTPCCIGRTEVLKFRSSGTLDKTFGGDGRVILKESPHDAHIAAALGRDDGSLVLAGSSRRGVSTILFERAVMIRLSSSGEIAPGPTDVPLGPQAIGDSAFNSLATGPDGTVIAAGRIDLSNGADAPNGAMLVARFSGDGMPDATFGAGGTVVVTFDEGAARASDVIVNRAGSITVAGTATYSNNSLSSPAVVLARLKRDGVLDTTFGGDGKSVPVVRQAGAVSLTPRPGGAIAVAIDQGGCSPYTCGDARAQVIGVTAKGKLDRAFGSDGFASVSKLFQGGLRLAPQGDEIIVAGTGLNEPDRSCPVGPCFFPRQGNGRPFDFAVDRLDG